MSTEATAKVTTVKEIMTPDPIRVGLSTTVRELVEILVDNEISGVPVVDALDRVVGVVSKTDLLNRCLAGPGDSGAEAFFVTIAEILQIEVDIDQDARNTVEEFMSTDPLVATPDEPIDAIARRMADNGVHRIVVTDENRYVVGVVTTLDLMDAFAMREA